MKLVFASGFSLGVIATLGITQVNNSGLLPSGMISAAAPPPIIGGPRSSQARIESLEVALGDWKAWFIHSENGYRQVVYSMPGQPGVLVGELYDDQGLPVGPGLARERERNLTEIDDLERLVSWLSRDFVFPPSVPEVQERQLNASSIERESSPIYIMLDPFDGPARAQRDHLIALMEEPHIRIIPVPNAGPGAFDGMHAIFEAGSSANADETAWDLLARALDGEVLQPKSEPGDPEHERAFMEFSKNVSLQRRLGIEQLPAVIHRSNGAGIEVFTLRSWTAGHHD